MKAIAARRFRSSLETLIALAPGVSHDTIEELPEAVQEAHWQAIDDGIWLYRAGASLDFIAALVGKRMPDDLITVGIEVALDAEGELRPEDHPEEPVQIAPLDATLH